MDRQGSDFLNVCRQVKEMLGSNAVDCSSVGEEADFEVVDLVKNRAIVWHDETQGATLTSLISQRNYKKKLLN